MNSDLKRFLCSERRHVFLPDPDFAARVVARAAMLPSKAARIGEGIWDVVPVAARPVFALAMGMILAFFVIQTIVPVSAPRSGLIDSYMAGEGAEGRLYVETDLQTSDEAIGEWIVSEGGL